jgi:hypothetical protein
LGACDTVVGTIAKGAGRQPARLVRAARCIFQEASLANGYSLFSNFAFERLMKPLAHYSLASFAENSSDSSPFHQQQEIINTTLSRFHLTL